MMPSSKTGFNLYIDKILQALLSNDNLMKLLYYNTSDALMKPNLTQEQKIAMIYNRIFPYSFISNTVTEEVSYINMSFRNFRQIPNSRVYQAGKIYFLINCHKNIWRTDFGLRPLCIMNEILETFTNSKTAGLGELRFSSSDECAYDKDLCGFYVAFDIIDFCNNI
jgi:hypothetical protein